MRERDPKLPEFMPPGPDNPLGSHALYLSWPSYRIHGTSDTRKIGRQSSSGCIGLYNEQIEELFNSVEIGTPVRILQSFCELRKVHPYMKEKQAYTPVLL